MNFNFLRLRLLFFILLLIISSVAMIYFLFMSEFWLISIWCLAFVILFSVMIIKSSEKSKRDLLNFVNAIVYDEFQNTYTSREKSNDLDKAFEALSQVYKKLRIEREENHLYLKTIIEHINLALLCFDKHKNIVIINDAAYKFFEKKFVVNIGTIQRFDSGLSGIIENIKGGQKKLYKFVKGGNLYNISIHATEFKMHDEPYKLISIQDVRFEMEEQELDAWRKLVRVLTHEIMNTAIPISTLAGVTNQLLLHEDGREKNLINLDDEDQADLRHSLKTIEKRSRGMVEFVKATKSYTNMPLPKFEEADIKLLLEDVIKLLKPGLEKNIDFSIVSADHVPLISIDVKLIEQLFINLIKNAIEAIPVKSKGKIKIELFKKQSHLRVEITDNGKGMDAETLENIFVPFYTTKSEGSGIGLSLSRQIMKLHAGEISVSSILNKGTKIELKFNV